MIIGIGVDTATVARIEKSLQRQSFAQKVYSPDELAALAAHGPARAAESAAAAWAAKEAFGKALGTGVAGFELAEVQVLHKENGAPYFAFAGSAAQIVESQKLKAHLSITHEGGYATAFVVLETDI